MNPQHQLPPSEAQLLAYLSGTLPETEQLAMQSWLHAHPEVADALEVLAESGMSTEAINKQLASITAPTITTLTTTSKMPPRRWWLAAAAVALAFIATGLYLSRPAPHEKQLAEWLSQDADYSYVRGESDASPAQAQIEELYRQRDYETALSRALDMLNDDPFSIYGLTQAGQCALQLQQYSQAEDYFNRALSLKGTTAERQTLHWHLALSYVAREDFRGARTLLDSVARYRGQLGQQAVDLLETLPLE